MATATLRDRPWPAKNVWLFTAVIAAAIALLLSGFVAARDALGQMHAMSSELAHVSARLESLEQMNIKLSTTNALLRKTNVSLETMIVDAHAANKKLDGMGRDIGVMSHKLSGSFLFRGVK